MKKSFPNFLLLPVLISNVSAISVVLDYSHTDTSSGFFSNATAQAAVQAAADDISAVITTSLNELTAANHSHTGNSSSWPSFPGATASVTGTMSYTNPDTGGSESFTGDLGVDEFRVFVGARGLGGSTLGQGGPGGTGFAGFSGSSFGDPTEQAEAAAALETSFNNAFQRGTSDLTVSSFNTGIFGQPMTLNFSPTVGHLWFDDDGSTTWHLDHTTAVAGGSSDLYSVALHEILHTIGIGTHDNWDALISGSGDPKDWTGAQAIAEYGTGTGIIDGGDGHIENGIMSTRLSDGLAQEVVMDPNITNGTRKSLTRLDLAFLEDIGWSTTLSPIPEPSTLLFSFIGLGILTLRRKRS